MREEYSRPGRAMARLRMGKLARMEDMLSDNDWGTSVVTGHPLPPSSPRDLLVIIVEEKPILSRSIGFLCDYLGIRVETVSGMQHLEQVLHAKRPMALMSTIDTSSHDGCHVLKTVAAYDRSLPVLLVTGSDPALLGAVEAVEEIWQLGQLMKMTSTPGIGDLVEFLFKAGRRSGSSLMPT